jgi:hypothetical protein
MFPYEELLVFVAVAVIYIAALAVANTKHSKEE